MVTSGLSTISKTLLHDSVHRGQSAHSVAGAILGAHEDVALTHVALRDSVSLFVKCGQRGETRRTSSCRTGAQQLCALSSGLNSGPPDPIRTRYLRWRRAGLGR